MGVNFTIIGDLIADLTERSPWHYVDVAIFLVIAE